MDERSGIRGAFASVLNWFTDSERFSEEWIADVNEFVIQLRNVKDSSC